MADFRLGRTDPAAPGPSDCFIGIQADRKQILDDEQEAIDFLNHDPHARQVFRATVGVFEELTIETPKPTLVPVNRDARAKPE